MQGWRRVLAVPYFLLFVLPFQFVVMVIHYFHAVKLHCNLLQEITSAKSLSLQAQENNVSEVTKATDTTPALRPEPEEMSPTGVECDTVPTEAVSQQTGQAVSQSTDKAIPPTRTAPPSKVSQNNTPTSSPRSLSPVPKQASSSDNLLTSLLQARLSSTIEDKSTSNKTGSTNSLSSIGEITETLKPRPLLTVKKKTNTGSLS